MRIIPVKSVPITAFGSHGVTIHHPAGSTTGGPFSMDGPSTVVIGELVAGAIIGKHPAVGSQLLLVAAGSVVVTGNAESVELMSGQAVLFDAGEEHETRAITPTVITIFEGSSQSAVESGPEPAGVEQ